jgi:hypothetical protein
MHFALATVRGARAGDLFATMNTPQRAAIIEQVRLGLIIVVDRLDDDKIGVRSA